MKKFGDDEFIKVNRKIVYWEWYSDPIVRGVFLHCLIMANWAPGKWKGIPYKRGDFFTSLASLAKETGFSYQQIRTSLNKLVSTNELTIKTTNKYSVITVNNYDKYQVSNKQNNKQSTNNQQTINKQITTDKEYKEYKEEKKKNRPSGQLDFDYDKLAREQEQEDDEDEGYLTGDELLQLAKEGKI